MDPLAGHSASYFSSLVTAAKLVKQMAADCRIVVGGPAFSLFARQVMEAVPQIDAGLVGEGETQFSNLIAASNRPWQIPGCVWRQKDAIRFTPGEARQDMAALPAIRTDLFDPAVYQRRNAYVASMGIEGKRGCDLNCTYCVYPKLGGSTLRLRPPEHIVNEIETLYKTNGITLFYFTDGVINRPSAHFEDVCRLLRRRRLNIQWAGFFREDHLNSRQLALALDAGLAAVYLSGDALTGHGLQLLHKQLCIDDLLQAARLISRYKVLTVCHFMANLPGETPSHWAEARATLETLLSIHAPAGNLGAVIFNNIRLYPGAALTRRLIRQGWLSRHRNLLYPVYYDPSRGAHIRHELEIMCHTAGVISRLGIDPATLIRERAGP